MTMFLKFFGKLSSWMNTFAGVILFLMMMLTVVDVFLRAFGKPLVGTYELVSIAGALVIGFAIAETSWQKGHVFVDFIIENRSPAVKNSFIIGTRIVGILIFALLSRNLFLKGAHLYKSQEVSLTLHIPHFPAAFALSFCFCVLCFVFIADIVKVFVKEGSHE
jgi:TRAP-type C4-dicarboxylate transport system permease small subunit